MGYWHDDDDNDYWALRDEQNDNRSDSFIDDYDEISTEKMLDTSSAANMVFWWDD